MNKILSGQYDRKILFKNIPIDLMEFAFGIMKEDYSNIIEIFRLEGKNQPVIRKNLIQEYADNQFRNLLFQWNNYKQHHHNAAKLSDINIDSLVDIAGNLRLMRCQQKNGDFSEYNIYSFIEKNIFVPKGMTLYNAIREKNSVVGLMYHACCTAAMIECHPIHALHFNKNEKGDMSAWLSMFVPFYHEDLNYPDHILWLQKRV